MRLLDPAGQHPTTDPLRLKSAELRRQVAGRHVVVSWYKRDRWKRLIGVVRLADEDMC
jgi:hypothetical protein